MILLLEFLRDFKYSDGSEKTAALIGLILVALLNIIILYIPTAIAFARKHKNRFAILALNSIPLLAIAAYFMHGAVVFEKDILAVNAGNLWMFFVWCASLVWAAVSQRGNVAKIEKSKAEGETTEQNQEGTETTKQETEAEKK